MPLKHRIETAYVVLLSCMIILAGVVSSLLPLLPDGFFYWCVFFALACFYPLFLRKTFRLHRADKIFRFLHWFPASLLALWFLLALMGAQSSLFLSLFLFCFSFFGLALVLLGLAFLAAFCWHVVRRRGVRLEIISLCSIVFLASTLFVHMRQMEASFSRILFPTFAAQRVASSYFSVLSGALGISVHHDIDDHAHPTVEVASSHSSFLVTYYPPDPDPALLLSLQEREKLLRMSTRVHHLPRTGPEHILSLALFLLAFYTALLHYRAAHRQ